MKCLFVGNILRSWEICISERICRWESKLSRSRLQSRPPWQFQTPQWLFSAGAEAGSSGHAELSLGERTSRWKPGISKAGNYGSPIRFVIHFIHLSLCKINVTFYHLISWFDKNQIDSTICKIGSVCFKHSFYLN